MITTQENKNIAISSLVIVAVFLFIFLENKENLYNSNTSFVFSYIKNLPFNFGGVFIYIILPTLNFIFLQKILIKYLNFLWSTSICFLSFFSYAGYEFKKFIFSLFLNFKELEILNSKTIIILEQPNVSFFILIFLIIMNFCLKINRYKFYQIFLITIFWSLFSLFSSSGSIIGLIFWIIYSSIRIFRIKKTSLKNIFLVSLANLILFSCLTFLFNNNLSIESNSISKITNYDLFYFIYYFLFPLVLIFLVYFFYKVDFYEIFIKFMPIYVLMFTDFILTIYLIIFKDFQNSEFFIYPTFILHLLYFVPVVYYLSRPLSPFVENRVNKKNILKNIYLFFLTS